MVLGVTVNRDVSVRTARVMSGAEPFASEAALQHWHFKPATRDGSPVAAPIRFEVKLKEPPPPPKTEASTCAAPARRRHGEGHRGRCGRREAPAHRDLADPGGGARAARGLWRSVPGDRAAKLRFQPYANADANDDGEVTLGELGKVPITAAGITDLSSSGIGGFGGSGDAGPFDADLGDAGVAGFVTFEDYVYRALVPAMFRYQGVAGSCTPGDVPDSAF